MAHLSALLAQILRRFFHSNTMTLQSLTMYNSTMPQSRWMWLITTSTFQPSFSGAALFLPFHIFFYNLIGLFVLRNARNQHWSGEHACIRLRVQPLDPESGSYQGECWRRRRRVLVCSKLFTVTCLVTCPSWGRSHRNLWKPQNLKVSESQNPREFWVWGMRYKDLPITILLVVQYIF